jgi:hypothetical protein
MPLGDELLNDIRQNNPSVVNLNLSRKDLSDDDIDLLVEALKQNTVTQDLILCDTGVSDKGAKALAKFLLQPRPLVYLDLTENKIGDEGAIELFKCEIKELNLAANRITDIAAQEVLNNPYIIEIMVEDNLISYKLMGKIEKHVQKNKNKFDEKPPKSPIHTVGKFTPPSSSDDKQHVDCAAHSPHTPHSPKEITVR